MIDKGHHPLFEAFMRSVAPDVRIVGFAVSLKQAEVLIKKLSPKLLFLDVQFDGERETGFDLLNKLSQQGKNDFKVIIMSAFNEKGYYEEAFKHGVVHFLTKPFDTHKLYEAVTRVRQNMNHVKLPHRPASFQHHSKNLDKLTIDGVHFTEVVLIHDIVYLEAWGRCTNVYQLSSSKPICSSVNLGEYEKKLQAFSAFCRIHRNMIVNTNYISRYSKKDRSIILPSPFKSQYASKERFKEFEKLMDTHTLT